METPASGERSPEMIEIIGRSPNRIGRWAALVILIMFGVALIFLKVIRYQEIVIIRVTIWCDPGPLLLDIHTYNTRMLKGNGDTIKSGEPIALISSRSIANQIDSVVSPWDGVLKMPDTGEGIYFIVARNRKIYAAGMIASSLADKIKVGQQARMYVPNIINGSNDLIVGTVKGISLSSSPGKHGITIEAGSATAIAIENTDPFPQGLQVDAEIVVGSIDVIDRIYREL